MRYLPTILFKIFKELPLKFLSFSFLIFLLGAPNMVRGQCSPSIPNHAEVVNGTSLYGISGDTLWVCNGASLDLESASGAVNNNVVYLEQGATVRMEDPDGNDGQLVYAKGNSLVEIGSNASNVTVNHVSSANINDNGTGTQTNSCSNLTYDYSSAPSNGCAAASVEESDGTREKVEVYSTNGTIHVRFLNAPQKKSEEFDLTLYDMNGKKVFEVSDVSSSLTRYIDLPDGVYFYRLSNNHDDAYSGKMAIM